MFVAFMEFVELLAFVALRNPINSINAFNALRTLHEEKYLKAFVSQARSLWSLEYAENAEKTHPAGKVFLLLPRRGYTGPEFVCL